MLNLDFGFLANYRVKTISYEEINAEDLKPVCYAHGEKSDRYEGLGEFIRVFPSDSSESWTLQLIGDTENKQVGGIFACPDPEYFLAIVDSIGYYVCSKDSSKIQSIDLVRSIGIYLEYSLILLSSFTDITAISKDGIIWKSESLCIDDLRILNVYEESITGRGDNEFPGYFEISTRDGSIVKSEYSGDWF